MIFDKINTGEWHVKFDWQQKQLATCPALGGGEEVLVFWSKGRRCNSRIS